MLLFCLTLCCSALPLVSPSQVDQRTVLRQLWEDYQRYGLPRPPGDATVARIEEQPDAHEGGKAKAFLVLVRKKHAVLKKSEMLGGCEVISPYSLYRVKISVEKPDSTALNGTQPMEEHHYNWRRFPSMPDLGLAIQCHALGWDELAAGLLNRHQKYCVAHGKKPQPLDLEPRATLARMAWNYWCNQFASETVDRGHIVEKMRLLAATPYQVNSVLHQNVIADMAATLKPGTAPRGSLEEAIDQLVDLKTDGLSLLPNSFDSEVSVDDPLYYRLSHSGLEGVPTLIKHLDDFRMTRCVDRRNNHWNVRIADVVAVRLSQLVGPELRYDLLYREGRGVQIDRQHVKAWAAGLKAEHEKQYLLDHAFTFRREYDKEKRANTGILQTLAARYPDEFVRLWNDHAGKDDDAANVFAKALCHGKVSQKQKEELLFSGVKSGNRWWQYECAERCLGHPFLAAEVIAWLQSLSKKDRGERIVDVAVQLDLDGVWQALVNTARRLNVGQRIEIISSVSYSDKLPQRRLAFVREFVDDKSLNPEEQENTDDEQSSGGSPFHRGLRVCDVAAEKLAEMLNLDASPEANWKVSDWDALREKVINALQKHDERQKEKRP